MTQHHSMHTCRTFLFAACLGLLGTGTVVNIHAQSTGAPAAAGARSTQQPSTSRSGQERRTALAEADPCRLSAESPQCLKFRIDQLTQQVAALQWLMQQQPPVRADSRIEGRVNYLYKYLKLGAADSTQDIWSAIKRLEEKVFK